MRVNCIINNIGAICFIFLLHSACVDDQHIPLVNPYEGMINFNTAGAARDNPTLTKDTRREADLLPHVDIYVTADGVTHDKGKIASVTRPKGLKINLNIVPEAGQQKSRMAFQFDHLQERIMEELKQELGTGVYKIAYAVLYVNEWSSKEGQRSYQPYYIPGERLHKWVSQGNNEVYIELTDKITRESLPHDDAQELQQTGPILYLHLNAEIGKKQPPAEAYAQWIKLPLGEKLAPLYRLYPDLIP